MTLIRKLSVLVLISACPTSAWPSDYLSPGDWPQFRGRRASGVAEGQVTPVSWDVSTPTNIRWKTAIPGLGLASPIVCRGCVYIVTAVGADSDPSLRVGLYGNIAPVADEGVQSWELYCLSQSIGQICWKRTLHQGVPAIKRHTKASHANSTPATDGRHIVVNLGSEGLYCLDLCGNLRWKQELGALDSGYYQVPAAQWGFGSSPIIYQNMVIVQADVQKDSFLAAFDVCTGCELWRVSRQDVPTWSTPAIVDGPDRTELIVNGYRHTGGYDPWTGQELWKIKGGGDIPVPTPIAGHGLIFLSSAHGSSRPLRAVRMGVTGDITPTADANSCENIAWSLPRDGIYMQTPIIHGPHLYACKINGVLSCYDARSGELLYRERLGNGSTGFTASPVAAGNRLYFTNEEGEVFVVRAGAEFELLASNSMNDICMATPAISNGMLIIRTKNSIYAIEKPRRYEQFVSRPMRHRTGVRLPVIRSSIWLRLTGTPMFSSCWPMRGNHIWRGTKP